MQLLFVNLHIMIDYLSKRPFLEQEESAYRVIVAHMTSYCTYSCMFFLQFVKCVQDDPSKLKDAPLNLFLILAIVVAFAHIMHRLQIRIEFPYRIGNDKTI